MKEVSHLSVRSELYTIAENISSIPDRKGIFTWLSAPCMKSSLPDESRVGPCRLSRMMLNQSSKAAHGSVSFYEQSYAHRRTIRLRSMRRCGCPRNQGANEPIIESNLSTAGSISLVSTLLLAMRFLTSDKVP